MGPPRRSRPALAADAQGEGAQGRCSGRGRQRSVQPFPSDPEARPERPRPLPHCKPPPRRGRTGLQRPPANSGGTGEAAPPRRRHPRSSPPLPSAPARDPPLPQRPPPGLRAFLSRDLSPPPRHPGLRPRLVRPVAVARWRWSRASLRRRLRRSPRSRSTGRRRARCCCASSPPITGGTTAWMSSPAATCPPASCRSTPDHIASSVQMDATLKELTSLVKEVYPEARKKGTHFNFAIVFTDLKRPGYRVKEIGSTMSGRKGTDDSMTLQSQKFQIGDYLDIAITPPNRAPPPSSRMRPY
uniref:18 kDa Sin3-associated polypeptide n=1 Tax=Apteryx owenii TaxID=8824 RepID=A0A8B9P4J1_APTOW